MKIEIEIKPATVITTHKPTPQSLVRIGCYTSNKYTGNMVLTTSQDYIVFHYEKHRKKVVSRKRVNGRTKSVIEPPYWKTTYYRIPKALVENFNIKIFQFSRHFAITNQVIL